MEYNGNNIVFKINTAFLYHYEIFSTQRLSSERWCISNWLYRLNRATEHDGEDGISPITVKRKYAFKFWTNRERNTLYTYCRNRPSSHRKQLKHKPLCNWPTFLLSTRIYSTDVVLLQNSLAHNQVHNLIPCTLPSGPLGDRIGMDKLQWKYSTGDINEWLYPYVLLGQETVPRLRKGWEEEEMRGEEDVIFNYVGSLDQTFTIHLCL
jgi:hypothetical protein